MRPLWITIGHYHVGWFGPDGRLVNERATLDGRRVARDVAVARSGFHRIGIPPAGAEILVLSERPVQPSEPPNSIASKRSATTWDVTLRTRGIVRATVLNDWWWSLDGENRHYDGFDCDLVDTCFGAVQPGRYVLHHRWPAPIVFGFLASALTWVLAATLCAIKVMRRRSRKHSEW
jgi:hypothetical protein